MVKDQAKAFSMGLTRGKQDEEKMKELELLENEFHDEHMVNNNKM